MSKHQAALFTFTLNGGGSIGPVPLRQLWERASGTKHVSVGRRIVHGNDQRPIYTLYAPQDLADMPGVEARLRKLLEAAHLNASLAPFPG